MEVGQRILSKTQEKPGDQINNQKTMGKTSKSLYLLKLRVSIQESDRSGEGDNLNSSFIDIR